MFQEISNIFPKVAFRPGESEQYRNIELAGMLEFRRNDADAQHNIRIIIQKGADVDHVRIISKKRHITCITDAGKYALFSADD
jgi:hypothetical protein